MKRLRHPIRAIEEPFGKAGLVVAVIALVLGLTGAAFAAGKLTSTQKKEVEKIAKKFAGKPGANGAPGAQGPAGSNGTNGKDGANGTNGAPGASGKSVVATEFSGAHAGCSESRGGTEFEVEGSGVKHYACNGKSGKEGSPWTAGGTLPPNATETGSWGTAAATEEPGYKFFPISFPIPTALPPSVVIVHPNEESAPGCPGRGGGTLPTQEGETYVPTIPQAEPGTLCVYVDQAENAVISSNVFSPEYVFEEGELRSQPNFRASETGGILRVNCGEGCGAMGSWAVTGAEE